MKTIREEFEEQYIAVKVPHNNKQGYKIKYEYIGPWYKWDIPKDELQKWKLIFGIAIVIQILIFVISATRYSEINSDLIIGSITLLATVAILFEGLGIFQFCVAKQKISESTFRDIQLKLQISPIANSVLLILVVLLGVVKSLRGNFILTTLMILPGYFICAGISGFVWFGYRKIPFVSVKNEFRNQLKNNDQVDFIELE